LSQYNTKHLPNLLCDGRQREQRNRPAVLHFIASQPAARETAMKKQTVIALAAIFCLTAPAFADHNRTDEQGRKQGHWTEFPVRIDALSGITSPFSIFFSKTDVLSAEGDYVDGKRQGHWILQYTDGTVLEGVMMGGKMHGHWVERWYGGSVSEGSYKNGKRHGHWVERFASGGVEEGPYVGGRKHGKWVVQDANGDVHEGPYVGGRKHGQWITRKPDGTVEYQTWRNGEVVE